MIKSLLNLFSLTFSMLSKLSLFFILSISVQAKTITSLDITLATTKAALKFNGSCLHYKLPTRMCIWISWDASRSLTPYLDHYLPDVVVSVYRNADENPWFEARTLFDSISEKAQSTGISQVGSGQYGFLEGQSGKVIFKEVDVIGNPGIFLFSQNFKVLGAPSLLLKSTARPMKPYFQSMIDSLLWRGFPPGALPEEMASYVLGEMHHLGTGILNDWGGIYPHEGIVAGTNDAKASMVIAFRAIDLLTNPKSFGHIHQSLSKNCGDHCDAAAITENSKETLFQQIYPNAEDKCTVPGTDGSVNEAIQNEEGAYVWVVWRHYKGCVQGDGQFIGVTP